MSTTTTVMDNKNGSVLTPPVKVGKKSVTEDLMTTFSSPAAWLLVVALIVTWSAVAIIMFDLVDYKTFAGSSVNKLSKEPLRIIHQTVEESTDWLYGFISLLSDIVSTDDDDSDEGICDIQTCEVEPPLKKKEIRKDKPDRQEKLEKPAPKVIHKEKPEKQEKIERKEQPKGRLIQKDKPEREEKVEKKAPPKEEKKAKSTKVEEKVKKEVKDGKAETKTAEKGKQSEAKVEDIGLIKAKPKVKEEKAVKAETKSEKKGKQNQEESAEDPKRVVGKKQRQ
ncbi:triadin [Eretmochelys imbricata]